MKLYFIRHAITPWNQKKILQGRTDISLSPLGVSQIKQWRVPKGIHHWYVSPMLRTVETAEQLNIKHYCLENNLIEMNWGQWEGKSLDALRTLEPKLMKQLESRGLDLRPPNGESPREVRDRIRSWLKTLCIDNSSGVITHRGVIRAAYSLATGWDYLSKPDVNFTHNHAYVFSLDGTEFKFLEQIGLIADSER